MASPSLSLWPQEIPNPNDPTEPKQTLAIPKPKPKRGGKTPASSSSAPPTKKNPQRGLGVAQLERIIRMKRISGDVDGEIHHSPLSLPSIYEHQQMEAISLYVPGPAPICYVPHYRVGAGQAVIGYGPVSAIRSVMHEQYALDRFRLGPGSLQPELPSNQRAAAAPAGVTDHLCEFCTRKKLLMRGNLGFGCGSGVDHNLLMDEEQRSFGSFGREREIKEYEFFPHNSSEGSNGGCFGPGERGAVGSDQPSSSSASAAAAGSNFVDLSLKLF